MKPNAKQWQKLPMKVIIDDKIPFLKGVLEPYTSTLYKNGASISREDVKEADALIIRTRTRCDGGLLAGSTIQFIASATIGHDHIDEKFCAESNIVWANAPGCNAGSVGQYMAAALCFWSNKTGKPLRGNCIGIVGVGNTGSRLADLCRTLGMKVLLNDPPRERKERSNAFVDIQTILKEADIISLHVPLNRDGEDKTCHLINADNLSKMDRCSLLINTSRGEVVDNVALKKSLQQGRLRDAALDVWENEPDIDRDLISCLLLATPHIAGYSADGKAAGSAMAVRAFARRFGFSDLESWFPESIPPPYRPEFAPCDHDTDMESLLKQTVLHSYPIDEDDARLRESPQNFEHLRGSYPLRREFPAYQIRLNKQQDFQGKQLEKLGFQIADLPA